MEDIIAFGFLSFVLALIVALAVGSAWVLWSAAMAVPRPARMRWPWTVWLLVLPILSVALCFFVLSSLARSYRRYFLQRKLPGHGGCGYGAAIATGIFVWLSMMKYIPRPTAALAKRWPHLAGLVQFAHAASGWAGAAAGIACLALVIMMWGLRGQIRVIEQRVKNEGTANEALAWLKDNFNQPPDNTPTNDPPPNGR